MDAINEQSKFHALVNSADINHHHELARRRDRIHLVHRARNFRSLRLLQVWDVTQAQPLVYKIPPLKANEGHRANDWGDLANPLWKGRLRIVEKAGGAVLLFEDSQTGKLVVDQVVSRTVHSRVRSQASVSARKFEDTLSDCSAVFARADYDPMKPSVDAVLDSSRYFVVRVEESGKKAYIGMGFAERTDSFDFSE